MGCFESKCKDAGSGNQTDTEEQPKQYSWDKRSKVDTELFEIGDKQDGEYGRLPESIDGKQFTIKNCRNANIYLFDYIAAITIDECNNCRIFVGPVKSSLFIRNCEDCKVAAICQQFRARDCKNVDTFLCCATQPIIESSTAMKFGCLQMYYPQLEEQFKACEMSPFVNNWSNVYDFSPIAGERNFSVLPEAIRTQDAVPAPSVVEELKCIQVNFDKSLSIIPFTSGRQAKISNQACLVVFFHGMHHLVKSFIKNMLGDYAESRLIHCQELKLQLHSAQQIFSSNEHDKSVQLGSVVGLEYCGENICQQCRACLAALLPLQSDASQTASVFVSANSTEAGPQLEQFYTLMDMQMVC